MDTCKKFFDNLDNEEPVGDDLDNAIYGRWLDCSSLFCLNKS